MRKSQRIRQLCENRLPANTKDVTVEMKLEMNALNGKVPNATPYAKVRTPVTRM